MRHLSGIESGFLFLAVVFIIAGAVMLLNPTEADVIHQVYRRSGYYVEHVSKERARAYGVLAILFGGGMVWMVFAGRRR